jgi:hypothetical protein
MNYSLSVPNKEMSFPLNELTGLLAFEDDEEVSDSGPLLYYSQTLN